MKCYREAFDDGPGGWYGFIRNRRGPKPLEWQPGSVTSRSPWWIDYNHAPPGAGYLHMVFCLNTCGPETETIKDAAGPSRFIAGDCPTDFCGASVRVKTRDELLAHSADLILLVQGNVEGASADGSVPAGHSGGRRTRSSRRWCLNPLLKTGLP